MALRLGDQIILGYSAYFNPIQASIGQFYGIEINAFAMTATKTALWIVERQMMKETEENVRMHLVFVPLTSYANIVEDNAVRVDWDHVVPREKLDYIMGNPPFIVPKVSSERRRYIPIGYMEPNIFSNDLVFIMPSSTMYHFGILTSNVHIA